jgi:hypothetical protein
MQRNSSKDRPQRSRPKRRALDWPNTACEAPGKNSGCLIPNTYPGEKFASRSDLVRTIAHLHLRLRMVDRLIADLVSYGVVSRRK